MEKNYKIFYFDISLIKKYFLFIKNQQFVGKHQIFLKKNYFFFKNFYRKNIFIYNGNKFRLLKINYFHLGLRLGNFVFTRKPFKYIIKKKSKKKIKKR